MSVNLNIDTYTVFNIKYQTNYRGFISVAKIYEYLYMRKKFPKYQRHNVRNFNYINFDFLLVIYSVVQ